MSSTCRIYSVYIDEIVWKGIKAIYYLSRVVSIPLKHHWMSICHHSYLSSIIESMFGHDSKAAELIIRVTISFQFAGDFIQFSTRSPRSPLCLRLEQLFFYYPCTFNNKEWPVGERLSFSPSTRFLKRPSRRNWMNTTQPTLAISGVTDVLARLPSHLEYLWSTHNKTRKENRNI